MTSQEDIDFIGIGVGRSGTTWLSCCLNEHPQVLMSNQRSTKEVRYFDFEPRFNLGYTWYLQQFPEPRPGAVRGEFSPFYYINPQVPGRIKELFPNIKLLAVLRNPVEVVYSYFYYHRGAPWECIKGDAHLTDMNYHANGKNILNLGYYYNHFCRFFSIFPRQNIHIVLYDQLSANPKLAIQNVYRFLGVDSDFVPPSINIRINKLVPLQDGPLSRISFITSLIAMRLLNRWIERYPRLEHRLYSYYRNLISNRKSKTLSISHTERIWLSSLYRQDVEQLQHMIGADLSVWMDTCR